MTTTLLASSSRLNTVAVEVKAVPIL